MPIRDTGRRHETGQFEIEIVGGHDRLTVIREMPIKEALSQEGWHEVQGSFPEELRTEDGREVRHIVDPGGDWFDVQGTASRWRRISDEAG